MAVDARSQPEARPRAGLPLDALFVPAALLFVLFLFLPLAAMFWRAIDSGQLQDSITSSLVIDALKLSAITSTVSLIIVIIFGTPLAYVLARRSFPGKMLVDLLVDLPIVLPPTVAGVALLVAFGRRGVLGPEIRSFGIELAFTTTAVILAQTFVAAPYYIRTVKTGFASVDEQYEGVAATLGASQLRIFWRIVLPLSWPSVIAGAILCWARALGELGATLIFAGSFQGRTQTMPLAIIGVFDAGRTIDLAIALSVILVAAAALLLLLLRLIARTGGAAV
ncbi:MAG TPA: ABC transporter permease [Dehalococcoidia bacterium]|nr:ABC transporter permease [Dehalococcoidia bacterium]